MEKFKPKKTTDDCFTPASIYEAILEWACKEYNIDKKDVVRPFWPGYDYETYEYQDGCVVLDNPPFSILSKICKFYNKRGIKFFLFAPSLSCIQRDMETCSICVDGDITYENGARINTSFVTNLEHDLIMRSSPELHRIIKEIDYKNRIAKTKKVPIFNYPDHVITSARCNYYSAHGTDFKVRKEDAICISALDSQKEKKKGIYGRGLLLSERSTKEKIRSEQESEKNKIIERERIERERIERERIAKENSIKWELSEREKEIIKNLG